jgi:hypothetical protein
MNNANIHTTPTRVTHVHHRHRRYHQPVAAWTNKGDFAPPTPEPELDPNVMAQAWCHRAHPCPPERPSHWPTLPPPPVLPCAVSDSSTLNVAVLVAMPSLRKPSANQATYRHPGCPSYGEGQLFLGVTCLPCGEQIMRTALGGGGGKIDDNITLVSYPSSLQVGLSQ